MKPLRAIYLFYEQLEKKTFPQKNWYPFDFQHRESGKTDCKRNNEVNEYFIRFNFEYGWKFIHILQRVHPIIFMFLNIYILNTIIWREKFKCINSNSNRKVGINKSIYWFKYPYIGMDHVRSLITFYWINRFC